MRNSPSISRGLIIHKRWLDLILSGRKTWEMRSRATATTGLIALVEKGTGTVVGIARLTGCGRRLDTAGMHATTDRHGISSAEIPDVVAKGWTTPWHLTGARRLPSPIPYQHTNGAVTWVRLDDAAKAALSARMGEDA